MLNIQRLNRFVAASLLSAATFCAPALAQQQTPEELLERLKEPGLPSWQAVEGRLYDAWSETGSPARDLLMDRASDAIESENWPVAAEHLTAVIDHSPDVALAYSLRGLCYANMDMTGPAIEDLRVGLSQNPNDYLGLLTLAGLMASLGEFEFALGALTRAKGINPNRPEIDRLLEQVEREVGAEDL